MKEETLSRGPEQGPELIGRDFEREIIISALRKAAEGRGSMILIEGEAGIGKTHLLNECSSDARSLGFSIMWGRCLDYRKSTHLPFIEMLKDHFGVSTIDDYETNMDKVKMKLQGSILLERDLFNDFSNLFIPKDEPVGGYRLERSRSNDLIEFLSDNGYRTIFLEGMEDEVHDENLHQGEVIRIGQGGDDFIPPTRLERIARTLKTAFDRYRHLAVVNRAMDIILKNNPEDKVRNLLDVIDGLALKNSGIIIHLDDGSSINSNKRDIGIHLRKDGEGKNGSENDQMRKGMSVNDLFTTFINEDLKNGPILVIIEDLQWSDKASLNLLQYLARDISNNKLLIIGSYRPEEYSLDDEDFNKSPLRDALQRISRERLFETLTLKRLDRNGQLEMARSLIGEELDETLLLEMAEQTEGNPILIKKFLDERRIANIDPARNLSVQIEVDAITRRIHNLDEKTRMMLDFASVIGMECSLDMLVNGLDMDEEEALDRLDSLLEIKLVKETEKGLRFEHQKARMTIYDSISKEQLKDLHTKAATLVDSIPSHKGEDRVSILAEHYRKSGDCSKAYKAYIESAEERMDRMDDHGALEVLNKALECMEETPASRERDLQMVRVLQMIADVNESSGDTKSALIALKRAVDIAEKGDIPFGRSSSFRRIGDIMLKLFEWDQTVDYYLRSLHVSKKEDDQEEVAKAFRGLGVIYYFKGDYTRSMDCYLKYMEFPKKERKPLNVMALIEVGNIYYEMGDFNQALAYYKMAIKKGEETELKQESAYAYTRMADVLIKLREIEDAKRFATWGFNMVKDHVSSEITQRVVLEYIELMLESGDIERADEGVAVLEKVPERELGDRLLKGSKHRTLGLYMAKKRSFEEAVKHLETALEINRSLQVPFQLGLTTLQYGLVLFQQMKVDKAMSMLKQASITFKSINALYFLNRTSSKLRELTFIKQDME